jgi:predicted hydrocarbon binding protein
VHGLIFVSLRDYLVAEHGDATEREVMAMSRATSPATGTRTSGSRACSSGRVRRPGLSPDALLTDFGAFTAEKTFARLYPALFDRSGSARSFLLTVETRIHEVVRVAIPDALPPELEVAESGESGVSIVYKSPRRLCAMLRGLVEGSARHYGESAEIEERTCVHRGDDSCTFEVLLAR